MLEVRFTHAMRVAGEWVIHGKFLLYSLEFYRYITFGAIMSIPEISVQQLEALLQAGADVLVLDVRNQDEFDICHLNGKLIPLVDLPNRLNELNPEQHIVVHCHAGGRSRRATEYLLSQGFKQVENLRGGITAWANEIDPTMRKY